MMVIALFLALGTNGVSAILDGCAVVEKWTDADGSHGTSRFYYNTFAQTWTQVWVTDLATERDGLKEKFLVAKYLDGGVRFQGALPGAAGSAVILDRTTLTPNKDGSGRLLSTRSARARTTSYIG